VRGNAGGDPGIAWSRAHDSEPTRRPTDEEGRGYARELAGTRRPSPSSTWWLLAGRPDVHAIKKRTPDRGPTKVAEFPRLAQYSRLRANFNFARGSATTPTQRLNGLGASPAASRPLIYAYRKRSPCGGVTQHGVGAGARLSGRASVFAPSSGVVTLLRTHMLYPPLHTGERPWRPVTT
jgi:hypothetical protein